MLKYYNSTALIWYQTLSEWHYHISARKPKQLWFWWYSVSSAQQPELGWLPHISDSIWRLPGACGRILFVIYEHGLA
jgi:hypothetical protein